MDNQYKAIIFDAMGTLVDSLSGSLRTQTLKQTWQALIDNGVQLFVVSNAEVPRVLTHLVGPSNAFGDSDKLTAFGKILRSRGFRPEEVLCVGDRIDDEGSAARALNIRFIVVRPCGKTPWGGISTREDDAQLEKELAAIFGEDKIGGKTKAAVPQPKAARLPDLPLPKPPKGAGAHSAQPRTKPRKGFAG